MSLFGIQKGGEGTMKKLLLMTLVIFVFTVGLVFTSFAEEKPQYGGVLKVVTAAGPRSFYSPEEVLPI